MNSCTPAFSLVRHKPRLAAFSARRTVTFVTFGTRSA
jgi:hypothetical protein